VLQPLIPPTQYADLLKPNVIDRDQIFVPSGWDSWGKIRVLRDGFDVEGVCAGWSVDIASVLSQNQPETQETEKKQLVGGALEVYEDAISDPKRVSPKKNFYNVDIEFRCNGSIYWKRFEYCHLDT
jgi:dynein light intermediate chain 1, cytosolic